MTRADDARRRCALLLVVVSTCTLLSACVANERLTLPPAPPPTAWAELGGETATAYDCLLHSARDFGDAPREANQSSTSWRLAVGQEDRLRLQVAALRPDPFDRIAIAWDSDAFRALIGSGRHEGDLPDRSRLDNGRTAWEATVDVTLQASRRGTWEIAGQLVPRGGGGALTCAPATVVVS